MSSLEFSIADNTFNRYLELQHPIDHLFFNNDNVSYFDQDGFELTVLERASYEINGVATTNILNHVGDQQPWIILKDHCFKIDHSAIMQRWQFVNQAQDQLHQYKNRLPQLKKFLNLQPKWGLDFDLEYYDHDCYIEVIHIEIDYRNYYEAVAVKSMLEERIKNTDWYDFVQNLLKHREQWAGLKGFAQNDWKARYWGLNRAEVTEKAII
jgi:hypothetical protein